MNERVLAKGYLAETKKRLKEKDLEASGVLISLRLLLNPYEDDLSKIDSEKVLIMAKKFNECIEEIKTLKAKIAKLEAEIDG